MKRSLLLLGAILLFASLHAQHLTLVSKGRPKARIIIPEKPTVVEVQAAKVFQDYIERMTGATLALASDQSEPQNGEVLIGNVNRPEGKSAPDRKSTRLNS